MSLRLAPCKSESMTGCVSIGCVLCQNFSVLFITGRFILFSSCSFKQSSMTLHGGRGGMAHIAPPKFANVHHPHPLDYLYAKFRFFRGLHC